MLREVCMYMAKTVISMQFHQTSRDVCAIPPTYYIHSCYKGLIAQTSPEFRSNCTYMELLPIITQTSPAVSGQRLNLTIDSFYCRNV